MFGRSLISICMLARVAALMSLAAVLVGKTVHLYQECDCCGDHCSIESTQPATKCPFGCDHHAEQNHGPDSQSQESGHDEDSCTICFLLGQAPQAAAVVEVPSLDDSLSEALVVASEDTFSLLTVAPGSRGPPTQA